MKSLYILSTVLITATLFVSCQRQEIEPVGTEICFCTQAENLELNEVSTKAKLYNNETEFQNGITSFLIDGYDQSGVSITGLSSKNVTFNLNATDNRYHLATPYYLNGNNFQIFAIANCTPTTSPGTGLVTNYAITPSESKMSFDYDGTGSLNDASAQKDIMVARYSGNGGDDGVIPLTFVHALAAVQFKAGSTLVGKTVKQIQFTSRYAKGTFTYTPTDGKMWTVTGQSYTHINKYDEASGVSVTSERELIGGSTNVDNYTMMLIPHKSKEVSIVRIIFGDDKVYAGVFEDGEEKTYTDKLAAGTLTTIIIDIDDTEPGTRAGLGSNEGTAKLTISQEPLN